MIYGYARVSTGDQYLTRQIEALQAAGVESIHTEKMSGAKKRPVLEALMEQLKAGDVLIVQKIDRLGRSMRDMLNKLQEINEKGVDFRSLMDNIDLSTANGRLLFHLLSSIAEYEREMIRSRVKDGLESARRNGVQLGRRRKDRSQEAAEFREQIERGEDPREHGMKQWKYYQLMKEI